jgi:hypothetical protein
MCEGDRRYSLVDGVVDPLVQLVDILPKIFRVEGQALLVLGQEFVEAGYQEVSSVGALQRM